MYRSKKLWLILICCLPVLTGCNRAAQSVPVAQTAAVPEPVVSDQLIASAVEAWADELFARMLNEHRISGGAIAVTQGENVVLTKGFGYEDWVTRKPVSATSVFRIGSLSKTFLGTRVVQLYESGRIQSLDDPVNKYLTRLQVPDYQGKHITIRDLMTHQGGYGANGPIPDDPRPAAPLSPEMILANLPDIVREPGTLSIYCNACSAVIGIMIEDMTGVGIQASMQEHVFAPLRMSSSSWAVEPLPASGMVTQFTFLPGRPPARLPYPAAGSPYTYYTGAMNSTAADMSHWLIANIMAGEGSARSVLTSEGYQLMRTRERGNHPETSGFSLQHFIYDYNGERVLEHYGAIQFRSLQVMMLDREIGVFITVAGGGYARDDAIWTEAAALPDDAIVRDAVSHSGMRAAVLEYFLGKLPASAPPLSPEELAAYTGDYDVMSEDPAGQTAVGDPDLIVTLAPNADGLLINDLGIFRPAGDHTFVLDGSTPLEMGFRFGNRYSFTMGENGAVQMFPHVNAGGFVKR